MVSCGFCSPGMILSAKALLDKNASANEEEIKEAIAGNLCRCTGYRPIVAAAEAMYDAEADQDWLRQPATRITCDNTMS